MWRFLMKLYEKYFKREKEKPTEPAEPVPVTEPLDVSKVVWLHTDVSEWPITANLRSVTFKAGSIRLDYDKAAVWPRTDYLDAVLNANPWIFVDIDGVWHAATWEWLRYGQTDKPMATINGEHIKRDPLKDFSPQQGVEYGFMVSGMARDGKRNITERSNIVMVKYP